jgi:hypothetical protein
MRRHVEHTGREMHKGFWYGNLKGKRPLGRHRRKWEGVIKMDLKEIRCEWTGFIWLRTETNGVLLQRGNKHLDSVNCVVFLEYQKNY